MTALTLLPYMVGRAWRELKKSPHNNLLSAIHLHLRVLANSPALTGFNHDGSHLKVSTHQGILLPLTYPDLRFDSDDPFKMANSVRRLVEVGV